MDIIKSIEQEYIKENVDKFEVGATVKVSVKIQEGTRTRIQIFEGTVIKKQNSGLNKTFTVRKISNGVGVERTFPVNSPRIEKIEVTRNGKARRAKLYYLRDRVGKAAKLKVMYIKHLILIWGV
jgi:large subunit ribosomal protein L19